MKLSHLLFVLFTLFSLCTIHAAPPRKQLAGPPSTFDSHSIWKDIPTVSKSALQKLYLEYDEETGEVFAKVNIPVDVVDHFELIFGSPFVEKLDYELISPSGKFIELRKYSHVSSLPIGATGNHIPVLYFDLNLLETGFYEFVLKPIEGIDEDDLKNILENEDPDGFVLTFTQDNLVIEAMLLSPVVSAGRDVGLKARLLLDGKKLSDTTAKITISEAIIDVTTPSGKEIEVPMNDDGIFADEVAGDHFYSGSLELNEAGDYEFEATLSGWIESDGEAKPFTKTIDYIIPTALGSVEFKGTAKMTVKDSERALIHLDMVTSELWTEPDMPNYRAYTEVYGYDESGVLTPSAWIGSIVNIVDGTVTLELNINWLSYSKVQGPLTLKNTYLVDMETLMVVATYENEISVSDSKTSHIPEFQRALRNPVTEITDEMRYGVNPLKDIPVNQTSDVSLILLHGYCASENPWKASNDIFDNAAYFLDANANLPIDDFAIKVDEFAKQIGTNRFSIIGHSQGGMVGLHLLTFYWSGLENSEGGKKIQTVGTPWQGCSGAGSIANLGKTFGITCGKNNDLTTNGAQNWLAGIDMESRSEVDFYITTYKQGTIFGDYCNAAVNLILKWPNDGTAEEAYSHLPGGNHKGTTQRQCHTTGMKYEAQYLDPERNKLLNQNAAR